MTTADRLLARLLDHPGLVSAVQRADPQTFCAVLEDVGLADAGELLALATPDEPERIEADRLFRLGWKA